jgi:hypothetical protein
MLSSSALIIVALLLVLSAWRCSGNNRQPPNASRLKTDQSKMRSMESRSGFKQQQGPANKRFSPKFGDLKPTEVNGALTSTLVNQRGVEYLGQGDIPVFTLFVRRLKTGPWTRFEDVRGDDTIRPVCESVVLNGGLEAESLRESIDGYMITRLFGDEPSTAGGGQAVLPPSLLVNKIKGTLPQLKKLRPRDLEIGYKLAAEGEDICSLTAILLRAKEEAHRRALAEFNARENRQLSLLGDLRVAADEQEKSQVSPQPAFASPVAVAVAKLDLDSLLLLHLRQTTTPTGPHATGFKPALDQLHNFVAECPEAADFDVILCSDGSASMCGGGGCTAASAGVVAVCTSVNPREQVHLNDDNAEEFGNEEKEKEEEMRGEEEYRPDLNVLRVHVAGVAGVVETPFDAELVAGLAATTLALELVAAVRKAPLSKPLGRLVLLTDSKTLIRAARTGPDGNPELAKRGGPQRQLLWAAWMKQLAQLEADGVPFTLQWTAGHPERRGGDPETWSFEDWAIWEADDVARPLSRPPHAAAADEERPRAEVDLTDLVAYAFAFP